MGNKKGLLVFVLRASSDCSLNGLTKRFDKFVLTGDGVAEVFEPSAEAPELRLCKYGNYLSATPPDSSRCGGTKLYSAGGNFVTSSDSRFPNRYPISVHDRDMAAESRTGAVVSQVIADDDDLPPGKSF